jgi:SAM-dependent methyltransferase
MTTIDYYNEQAEQFFQATVDADISTIRQRFLDRIRPGGEILDAGCGSGRDSAAFVNAGYQVTAFDASAELVRLARKHSGTPVLQMRFQDIEWSECFDGIWACASLLHVPNEEMVPVFLKLAESLRKNATLYGSFKLGVGEVERGGRRFTNHTEQSLRQLIERIPQLTLVETWISEDVRPERSESWLNFFCIRALP